MASGPSFGGAPDLARDARELLEANTRHGERAGRRFSFSVPSPRVYPFQWFWDSCFHAIVWTHFDLERAKEELRGLLTWQRPDGLIPHVIFWDRTRVSRRPGSWHQHQSVGLPGRRPATTARIQPPVLAQAIERIVELDTDDGFLHETLGPLTRFHRYLAEARDPDRDHLISVVSSFETGLDFSPVYDPRRGLDPDEQQAPRGDPLWLRRRERLNKTLRGPERVVRLARHHHEDVLMNSINAQALRSLARLATRARDGATADWATGEADAVTAALLEKCWDAQAGLFFNLAGAAEEPVRLRTISALMPLILPGLPRDVVEALAARLLDPGDFWLPYPIASVARSEPTFRAHRTWLIWRGPMSMNTNWFLIHALRLHGWRAESDEAAERSREAVARGGFNEFYNPLTGGPVGAENFGWATLVVDLHGRANGGSRQSAR